MSNVHFFRSWLPNTLLHTCHQGDGRRGGEARGGGVLRGFRLHRFTTDSNKLGEAFETAFFSRAARHRCVMMSPRRGMRRQRHFKCNTTARQRPSVSRKDPTATVTCGCIFLTGVIIFRGQTSTTAKHTNNKTVGVFLKRHKSFNEVRLKFMVRFTLSSDLPLKS